MKIKKFFIRAGIGVIFALCLFLISAAGVQAAYGDVSAFVGTIYWGDGKDARQAFLDFPEGLTHDGAGTFYIADTYNNVIRKIDPANKITKVAGSGSYGDSDGKGSAAKFAMPTDVARDHNGNLYVADTRNHKIKKIFTDGNVKTIVSQGLSFPGGVAVVGSTLYIADSGNNAVKAVSTNGGVPSLFSGGYSNPKKLTNSGQYLFVSDTGNNRVIKLHKTTKQKTVVVTGLLAPNGLAQDGNFLYISDDRHDAVKRFNISTGQVETFTSDTTMTTINFPHGIVVYGDYVYVLNTGISTLQRFNKHTAASDSSADKMAGYDRFGNRYGSSAGQTVIGRPYVMEQYGSKIYLAENNKIISIDKNTGASTHIIGNSVDNYKESTGEDARFSTIQGMAISKNGNWLYVADRFNNRIRLVNIPTRTSFWISGVGQVNTTGPTNGYKEGPANTAKFNNPSDVVRSPDGLYLYVSDTGNNRIRKVRLSDGYTFFIAGSSAGFADGQGANAKFNKPLGLTMDAAGKYLYVADTNNHRIRRVRISDGVVTTVAGSGQPGYRNAIGTKAFFSYPEYVAMGADGKLYVSDVGGMKLRWVNPSNGDTRLVSGSGARGFANGGKLSAQFNNPKGILPDVAHGVIYVADSWNDMIRKVQVGGDAPYVDPAPIVSSVAPSIHKSADNPNAQVWLKVTGANFMNGASTRFNNINAIKTYVGSSELAVVMPLGQMPEGWYNVFVRNVDGQERGKYMAFGVSDADGNVPNVFPGGGGDVPDGGIEPAAKGFSFFAYEEHLRGGFYGSAGDVSGDGRAEIVTGTSKGLGPQVSVFDQRGNVLSRFFVYAPYLRSGVRTAVGNVDGSGKAEIITGPGPGGRPHIRIFRGDGKLKYPGFFALDGLFQGGVFIASGDVDGNGEDEIIVTPAKGGGPHVTIHKKDGTIVGNFMAYDEGFRGGIKVAAVDTDGDGIDEIVTAPEEGRVPVRVFSRSGVKLGEFYPFGEGFSGGISVAGGNTNRKPGQEIIVGAGPGGGPLVRAVNKAGSSITPNFFMYRSDFRGGVNVGAGDVNADGIDEIIGAPASIGGPNFRIINPSDL